MQLHNVETILPACASALANKISFESLVAAFVVVIFEVELDVEVFVVIDEEPAIVVLLEIVMLLEVCLPPVLVEGAARFCALTVTVTVRGYLDEQ